MRISRRGFLERSGAVALGFLGLRALVEGTAFAAPGEAGYGPLVVDPDRVLDLPRGFRYRVIGRRGDEMDDGLLLPDMPDGMATFAGPDGLTILIRNHELMPFQRGPFGANRERLGKIDPRKLYDFGGNLTPGCGGTTTVVYDTKTGKVVRQFLSLVGTYRNCAGGPTPWGSWISCEESVVRRGIGEKGRWLAEKHHGYCFEVAASATIGIADPTPLKAMGRFNHEAVAVEPRTGIVYQTEDRHDGLLYRFVPKQRGKLAAGGKLQALKLREKASADTRNWTPKDPIAVGQPLPVTWLDVDDIDAPKDDLRQRGFAEGAARFARGEGMWYGKDAVYFACTNGGAKANGQIWRYAPSPAEGTPGEEKQPGTVELFVEPNDTKLVCNADNLTVAPWGDLIVCEDRPGDEVRLIGVTPNGAHYTFGFNHLKTEFAGVTFSPDGSTLFVNIQGAGLTLAITGPWT